jgi:hypothetical protein
MAMTRLQTIEELLDAEDELRAAWDELTTWVSRRLEGWDDPPSRVDEARLRVRLAIRTQLDLVRPRGRHRQADADRSGERRA